MIKLDYISYLKEKDLDIERHFIQKMYKPIFLDRNENLLKRFNRYKKQNYFFGLVFKKITLKKILLAKDNELLDIITLIETRLDSLITKHQTATEEKIKNIFRYKEKYQSAVLTPFFTDNFNFRTCFYCNKDFITNFEKNKDTYASTFQLDHFYDKRKYPYLALSFYNLIPSCSSCNSGTVKGTKDCFKYDKSIQKEAFKNELCLAPNHTDFHFDKKVKFKLLLNNNCKNLQIKTKEDIETPLKENYSNKHEKYIEIFKLNERYQAHKDIVYEMIRNAQLYPESRLKELQDLTGIPYQQIKKDIFNLIDEDADLSKEPFSKLIKDISQELKLI